MNGQTTLFELPSELCFFLQNDTVEPRGKISKDLSPIKEYADSNHYYSALMRCQECGQLYYYEYIETVDWISEQDPSYCTWVPVKDENESDEMSKKSSMELLKYFSIHHNFPGKDPDKYDPERVVNRPDPKYNYLLSTNCSASEIFEAQSKPQMKLVPKDLYPYFAKYQECNPEGYIKTIDSLRRLCREPNAPEEEFWGQIESDLEHLNLV